MLLTEETLPQALDGQVTELRGQSEGGHHDARGVGRAGLREAPTIFSGLLSCNTSPPELVPEASKALPRAVFRAQWELLNPSSQVKQA